MKESYKGVVRVYYERTRPESPWAVRTWQDEAWHHQCAVKVVFEVPTETEGNPDEPSSQKYYIKGTGELHWDGQVAIVK